MPEIKIKHIVSFSSEDKVHKAENLLKEETYRKWTCATPGEKSANVVLQLEKATQIHSIDIGNENSAFVEILVGRSSDSLNDFQVLLVASSFMSPLESRTGTHKNRVRMFGPEKLSQNVKNEKWDCVQIVCTQPFNKNTTFGLTFIKLHSPPEKVEEEPKSSEAGKATAKLGAFKIKYDEDDEDTLPLPAVGSWFGKKKTRDSESSNSSLNKDAPSYAAAILSSRNSPTVSSQNTTPKRKSEESSGSSEEPPSKKPTTSILNKDHIIFKDILDGKARNKKTAHEKRDSERNASNAKAVEVKKTKPKNSNMRDKADTSSTAQAKGKKNVPFEKLMDKVVIVLSGFVNPLRGDLRDKALEMGAKYKADWDSSCTHLICAFLNTPKYDQVDKLRGKIVSKEWILDCYKKKQLLPWEKYILGKPSKDLPSSEEEAEFTEESEDEVDISDFDDSEDSDEEYVVGKKTKGFSFLTGDKTKPKPPRVPSKRKDASPSDKRKKKDSTPAKKGASNTSNARDEVSDGSCSPSLVAPSGSRDESETEDEEALQDYKADTDVESESGGDTEDEIRKVEQKAQKKQEKSPRRANGMKMEVELSEKPDISDLPLPELPNIFKQRHFFLYGDFSTSKEHELQRYITAYNGILEDYMSGKIKYVITEKKWDKNFDDALNENEDLIFVKSAWIYKCHEAGKLVPYQPYIVIPDS